MIRRYVLLVVMPRHYSIVRYAPVHFLKPLPILFLVATYLLAYPPNASGDRLSSDDKMKALYSSHFGFSSQGDPRITVEIASGLSQVTISSSGGLVLLPTGPGGSEIRGQTTWNIQAENTASAKIRRWAIVDQVPLLQSKYAENAQKKWEGRNYVSRLFQSGSIFGIGGSVMDSRIWLVAIAKKGMSVADISQKIATDYGAKAKPFLELVERPFGEIHAQAGAISVRNEAVLWFRPTASHHTLTVHNVPMGGAGSEPKEKIQNRTYRGSVFVTIGKDSALTVVNVVPAETLLRGLVPAEIYPTAPMEALKAQAVAARTELIQKLGHRYPADPFLLCSSQNCQVYGGVQKEHPRTNKAIAATKGMVLIKQENHLADTKYSAACGGHTENNQTIWVEPPDSVLQGHPDSTKSIMGPITEKNIESFLSSPPSSFCSQTKYSPGRFRWRKNIDQQTLHNIIKKRFPQIGPLQNIAIAQRGVSGRIKKLKLHGTHSTVIVTGDLNIRKLFGGLRSSLFTMSKEKGTYRFHGAGFGHGVGLCQLGSMAMAQQGYSYQQILNHYYVNTSLHKLY